MLRGGGERTASSAHNSQRPLLVSESGEPIEVLRRPTFRGLCLTGVRSPGVARAAASDPEHYVAVRSRRGVVGCEPASTALLGLERGGTFW